MSSAGTLVNFNGLTPLATNHPHPHHHVHHHHTGLEGGGVTSRGVHPHYNHQQLQHTSAQLNMLDMKMSTSPSSSSSPCSSSAPSLSPVTPVNILQECYIGMWESDMSAPPPTKLETTDIMDMIEPSGMSGVGKAPSPSMSPSPVASSMQAEPGGTSPTTIIHHTPSLSLAAVVVSSKSPSSSCAPSSTSPTSSSSSTTSTSSSQYLVPLPSLGDPYGSSTDGTTCHLLDSFHSGMDASFHKCMLSDTSHVFQEGGYDAFISDMSQPPPGSLSHQDHHSQSHHHAPPPPHHHHPQHIHSLHDNGVLLLDMSSGPSPPNSLHHHHPAHTHLQLHDAGGGQCSPGCPCVSNSTYSPNSMVTGGGGGGDPFGGSNNHLHIHHHHPHEIHRHHSDYSSSWDDLNGGQQTTADLAGDYSILFRKESPSTSDSVVSYPDNDSESKSSSVGLSEISRHHPHISPPPAKRKVGRPPKKDKKLKRNEKKTGRLWEFIRDLLKNPEYCPSLVKWENHEEGHFRFVNSEKVAQLWGKIKGNPRMTYEKLSRAMRYYYKSHVFEPVLGRRLVYKFGYNATNWKPINPNFVSSSSSSLGNPHHHLHPPHHSHPHQYQHHHKMYN